MIELPTNRIVKWDPIDVDWSWIVERHLQPTVDSVAMPLKPEELHICQPYIDFIESFFDEPLSDMGLFTAWLTKECRALDNDEYCYGFPHIHNNDYVAVATVLQCPEIGGQTTLVNDMSPHPQVFEPRVGYGLMIRGDELHGVKRIHGDTPRIAIIAQFRGS